MAAPWYKPVAATLVVWVAVLLALAAAPAARADLGDPLDYYGGPVVHSDTGVVVAWGSSINPMFTNSTSGDPGLIKSFVAANASPGDIGGVLAQYANTAYVDNGSTVGSQTFKGSGQTIPSGNANPSVAYGGEYQITPSVTSTTIYDSQIQSELVAQIRAGHLPTPQGRAGLGTVYLVLFPAGDTECIKNADGNTLCSGTGFCAYHGDARMPNGTIALYEVLPDDTTGPMSTNCGPSSSALANETSYASHEWSESITDPLVAEAAYAPPLAWYDNNNCQNPTAVCGEIGDKCNQQQAENGGFTIQLEWSNLDMACEDTESSYSQPTASFASASSAVVGQPVSFDGTGSSDPPQDQTSASYNGTAYSISSGIAGYSWDWGDGSTGPDSGATATHTFGASGQYQVSLTVTDDLGFMSTVTRAVVVSSVHPSNPVATTGAASGIDDAGATLNGTVDTGGQPVSYAYLFGTSADNLNQSTIPVQLAPAPAGTLQQAPATLSGLIPSTTYYYKLVASVGGQSYPDSHGPQSFTTTAMPASGTATTPPPPTPTTPVAPPPPTSTPAARRLPSAATGGVSGLASSKATVSGSVGPDGNPTTYLVEFGTSTAYGHSSPSSSAGAGTSSVSVSATLTGLRPRTIYHYRLVATNAAGTSVGADRTFKTPAAPPPPPRFSFQAPGRMTVAALIAGKLRVSFHCRSACTAHFAVTVALSGIQRLSAIPVTLARGTGHLGRAGSGHATLLFTCASRATLARVGKLVISGYAVRGASSPSAPRALRLIVTR
jgi:PKD domain